jgi:hypothetical protein
VAVTTRVAKVAFLGVWASKMRMRLLSTRKAWKWKRAMEKQARVAVWNLKMRKISS